MLQQVVGEALTKLIRKLRRYFPAGALQSQQLWQVPLVRLHPPLCCAPALVQHAMPMPMQASEGCELLHALAQDLHRRSGRSASQRSATHCAQQSTRCAAAECSVS